MLERLPTGSGDGDTRALRVLRAELEREPLDFDHAAKLAWALIVRYRADADPRYLGYAEAVLRPWWESADPPPGLLLLRATLRQSSHQFEPALEDLDRALRREPLNAQAWLTRATILQVRGDYDAARRACVPLLRLAPELVAVTAIATVAGLTGEASKSYELLEACWRRRTAVTLDEERWALTTLADLADRLGRPAQAEAHFEQALALGRRDAYLQGAYADFLLAQARPAAVIKLLKDQTRADGLLLRLALAEAALSPRPAALTAHIGALHDRFQASSLCGDTVHRREQARFTLHLLCQPVEALRLALANWQVQREPADARVLLECARATENPAATRLVSDWISRNRLEDAQLAKWLR